jgi:hypothetical protein
VPRYAQGGAGRVIGRRGRAHPPVGSAGDQQRRGPARHDGPALRGPAATGGCSPFSKKTAPHRWPRMRAASQPGHRGASGRRCGGD